MTIDPTIDPAAVRRAQFVHALRHIADLTEREAIPTPGGPVHLTFYVRTDRELAERIAVAIGGEWHPDPFRGSSTNIGARTVLVEETNYASSLLDATVVLDGPKPERPQRTVDERLADDLTAAARAARENLEALNGVAITRGELPEAMGWRADDDGRGPDLRACCDHEHTSHLDPCPAPDCDCDGPTVATDR